MSNPEARSAKAKQPRRSLFRRIVRGSIRLLAACGVLLGVGMVPVNNDFSETPDGIEIWVSSNDVHAEFVLPMNQATIDWNEFLPADDFPSALESTSHVSIGWGDRGFFLQTPTWNDLKFSTATNALLLPSKTCLHVTKRSVIRPSANKRSVRLSEAQYRKLAAWIQQAFRKDGAGNVIAISGEHYDGRDAFFESHGTYHAFNTCNSWVGRGLKEAEVRVGWMTPLPKSVFAWLP